MTTSAPPDVVSFGRRLTDLAEEALENTALMFAAADGEETVYTRRDLDRQSNQLARLFAERGVGQGSTVVIGLPDDTWGKRVHAIIQPQVIGDPPSETELDSWCRERLSAYKCPKTYEFIEELPRSEAGKIRRSAMVAERTG